MEYSLEKAVGKAIVLAVEFPGVKIDRNEFLQKNFSKYFEPSMVNEIINTSPIEAKVDDKILNEIAINCIDYEKYKVTLLSAGAGVGGITTVPADMVQYFAHVFRISQKLAYVYGWPDIFNCGDDIDKTFDEEFFALLKKDEDKDFAKQIVTTFCENRKALEILVSENLIGYELDRVYKVDLALMFEALTEIVYLKSPVPVAINEIVELAKKYSTEKSSRFVNGVLSAICKKI